jgi:uncharacterized membrane protein
MLDSGAARVADRSRHHHAGIAVRAIFLVHITAGSLGLLSGYAALYAPKGGRLHRKSGLLFVGAMLTMCSAGIIMTLGHPWAVINIPAGVLSSYLVVTALATVRPPAPWSHGLHIGAMLVAFGVGATELTFGLQAVAGGGNRSGIPAFPFFLFASVGLIGSAGDFRLMRSGALTGTRRLARHLWRMCFALFIAAMSFFIGQADVIPEPIRIRPLLALPVLAVLVTMVYWLWKVRVRRRVRGAVEVGFVA